MKALLQGKFDIVKTKSDGSTEEYHFSNLILNSGLNAVAGNAIGQEVMKYCALGSGNSEPNVLQTVLDNQLGERKLYVGTANITWDLNSPQKSKSITYGYRFNQGESTGNISEIGIASSVNYRREQPLFCRALIKDNLGRPTVISKLEDEILEIYYTLKIIIPHDDVHKQIMCKGELYNTITRPAHMGDNSGYYGVISHGEIKDITSVPHDVIANYLTQNVAQYNTDSHKIKISIELSDRQGNHERGIRSTLIQCPFGLKYQTQYNRVSDNASIQKKNTESMIIPFEFSWGRA